MYFSLNKAFARLIPLPVVTKESVSQTTKGKVSNATVRSGYAGKPCSK